MRIVAETAGIVTLEGELLDQAALAGVLDTLFGLRLTTVEVSAVGPGRATQVGGTPSSSTQRSREGDQRP